MFSSRQQQFSWIAVTLRLLLVLSLWQGPSFWGHVHHSESVGLGVHLAQFHSGEADSLQLGWHWHLSLPENGPSQSSEDSEQPRETLPKIAVASGGNVLVNVFSAEAPVESISLTIRTGTLVRGRVGFPASFQRPLSPLQVLCRLNC